MINSAPRRNTLALTAILGVAVATVACGGAEDPADTHSAESSATTPGTGPLVAGGMDSGGSEAEPPSWSWNESPDGEVTTTLGDYVVGVRSTSPIDLQFREAGPGTPERMTINFGLATADGRQVMFDFEYTGVQRTFSLADTGVFRIVKNGEYFYGRAGTVTIEPVEADAIEVSFEEIAVKPLDEEGGIDEARDAELIGNGVVEGPVRRLCTRAADISYAFDVATQPAPAPLHDQAWIDQFCGTATD